MKIFDFNYTKSKSNGTTDHKYTDVEFTLVMSKNVKVNCTKKRC